MAKKNELTLGSLTKEMEKEDEVPIVLNYLIVDGFIRLLMQQ